MGVIELELEIGDQMQSMQKQIWQTGSEEEETSNCYQKIMRTVVNNVACMS